MCTAGVASLLTGLTLLACELKQNNTPDQDISPKTEMTITPEAADISKETIYKTSAADFTAAVSNDTDTSFNAEQVKTKPSQAMQLVMR